MLGQISELGVVASCTANFVYQAANGDFGKALLVPAAAYAISQVGEYYNLEMITKIGKTVLLSVVLATPGTAIGSAIHILGNRELDAKVFAILTGSAVTYHVWNKVLDFAAYSVAKAVCR